MNNPLVSIMIATRNRPEELRVTLRELKNQSYQPVDLIVIDDASDESLEPVVRETWPDALFVRQVKNAGQCQCRNEGFQLSSGKYILHLDDDAHLTRECDLDRAVSVIESRPEIGLLSFRVFN